MIEPVKSSVAPTNTPAQAKASVQQAAATAKAETVKKDTVQLSDEAQARALRQNGVSIPDIALQLRLDIKTVNGFFPLSKT